MTGIRLRCCVPHCRHSRGDRKGQPPNTESMVWICAEHWLPVARSIKRRRARLRHIAKRTNEATRLHRIEDADWRLFQRAMRQAIEIAGGLA